MSHVAHIWARLTDLEGHRHLGILALGFPDVLFKNLQRLITCKDQVRGITTRVFSSLQLWVVGGSHVSVLCDQHTGLIRQVKTTTTANTSDVLLSTNVVFIVHNACLICILNNQMSIPWLLLYAFNPHHIGATPQNLHANATQLAKRHGWERAAGNEYPWERLALWALARVYLLIHSFRLNAVSSQMLSACQTYLQMCAVIRICVLGVGSPYCTRVPAHFVGGRRHALIQLFRESERLCWVLQMSQAGQDSRRKKPHTVWGQIWSPMGLGGIMRWEARNTQIHSNTLNWCRIVFGKVKI
jgi:hypothetical protein